jgi:hypothetical protein
VKIATYKNRNNNSSSLLPLMIFLPSLFSFLPLKSHSESDFSNVNPKFRDELI